MLRQEANEVSSADGASDDVAQARRLVLSARRRRRERRLKALGLPPNLWDDPKIPGPTPEQLQKLSTAENRAHLSKDDVRQFTEFWLMSAKWREALRKLIASDYPPEFAANLLQPTTDRCL